jgi:hypothetical protein
MNIVNTIKGMLRDVDKKINELNLLLDEGEMPGSEMHDDDYDHYLNQYNHFRGQSAALNKVLRAVGGR